MLYVSSEIMGGLGNQLFQIFAAIAYGIEHNRKFIFLYNTISASITPRVTYWDNFLKNLKQYTTFDNNNDYNIQIIQNSYKYREQNFHFNIIPVMEKNVLLQGYYQSYKYFYPHIKEICELLELDKQQNDIKDKYEHYYNRESTIVKTISMHFRLGDYKKLSNYHPILPFEYYLKSLNYIQQNGVNQARVLYFCEEEDIIFIEPQIHQLEKMFTNYTFVRVSEKIPDWEQLLMMSLCDINIIANSSFSLFGAYLNSNSIYSNRSDHIVIYPSTWFGPALQTHNLKDLFFVNWKKIEI